MYATIDTPLQAAIPPAKHPFIDIMHMHMYASICSPCICQQNARAPMHAHLQAAGSVPEPQGPDDTSRLAHARELLRGLAGEMGTLRARNAALAADLFRLSQGVRMVSSATPLWTWVGFSYSCDAGDGVDCGDEAWHLQLHCNPCLHVMLCEQSPLLFDNKAPSSYNYA